MRIEALIVAVLAANLHGCGTCCPPAPEVPFKIRGEIVEAWLVELLERSMISDRRTLTCDDMCELYHNNEYSDYVVDIAACDHSIVDPPPADGAALAATVACSGTTVKYYCKGRRPLGHVEEDDAETDDLGGYLARCAHLEAASVVAFAELAELLAGLAAPAALVSRCRTAAAEEARHAAVIGALARARGARVTRPRRRACATDLRAIAVHNAVEGCVHEAWAAVGAAWQAMHAEDAGHRAAFAEIAVDEAGHAQLAWDLHAWFVDRLDAASRAEVMAAQRAALAGLPALAAGEVCPPELGMPDSSTRVAMAMRFAAGLAAAA